MADTKITGVAELDAIPAVGDWIPFVDVSDTSMSASGTTKKINADRFIYTTGTANTLSANLDVNSKNLTNVGSVAIGSSFTPSYKADILASAGSANILRAGQTGVSNGFTVASNGTTLTYVFTPSVTISGGTVTCVDVVETSSQEIKENLEEIPTVLDRLVDLKAYRYNRKGDPVTHKRIGLIAEQVGSVFPEVVADVTIYENDEEVTTKGINYGRMSTLSMLGLNELVGRLQTAKEFLNNKIEQGANKLADHEQRIKVLEAKVAALGAR